jgi:UTP--glucose-1-phosphate uridylyltransferase
VLISHESKAALNEYVSRPTELERSLRRKNKTRELSELARATIAPEIEVVVVHQDAPLGLGHAVLQARDHVPGDRFGVILPDDVLLRRACLGDMADAQAESGCRTLVAAVEVAPDEVSSYGIFAPEPDAPRGATIPAAGLVEKPAPADAPSCLAAIGRYVLPTEIFDALARTEPGAGGEIQLTDAIDALGGLHAFAVTEQRFDCGSKEGLFAASTAVRKSRSATPATPAVQVAAA